MCMYTARYTASMEKLPLKTEGGEGVWQLIFSPLKIATLPELLMSSLTLVEGNLFHLQNSGLEMIKLLFKYFYK